MVKSMEGSFKQGMHLRRSINGEYLDQLNNCQLLKRKALLNLVSWLAGEL
jgi:hypothetical protein